MKKYLKMAGYILAILLIITIITIVSKEFFKSYADTPTKEVTVSNITYEFEAEDINATTGVAHNIRVKSKAESSTSTKLSFPGKDKITVDGIKYTVDSIGNGTTSALGDTTGWTEITIPTTVTAINANAFKDCTTLTTVNFTKTSNCGKIGESAFYGCTSLSNLKGNDTSNRLPASIITIEDNAFFNCTALVKLDLHTGIKTLGENTFKGTTPLTELTIRSNIENHNNAFKGHTGITTLKFVGKDCTTIYDSMFEGCTGLTSVNQRTTTTTTNEDGSTTSTTKDYIVSIGTRAFFGCSGLNEKKVIKYSLHKDLKVGKDAYRLGGYADGVTEKPTINIEQSVDKANTEYYTNGIGKVTMDISSTDVERENPKDYIVCIDTTVSMDKKTNSMKPKKDKDGNDELDKDGQVIMVKRSKMEIAVEALQLLADKIYEENPENRLAIVTQKGNSYLFMNFLDGSRKEEVDNLIKGMTTKSKGNEDYGNKSAYYTSTVDENGNGTDYKTGLLTMSDVIMERQTGRDRTTYGIFISDGYPNLSVKQIQGSAEQLKGFCDAVWSVSIALELDTEDVPDHSVDEDDDPDWEEEAIDPNDLGRYLKYIRTYWGHNPLFYNFPDTGELANDFKEFMQSIVDVSTSSLEDVIFKSKLNTDIWEFYTGEDYKNPEGCDITDSQNAVFKIDRVGKDKEEDDDKYYYYIRLKDDKRDKTDPKLLVSNELTAEYIITGGTHNGEECNKENGKNALYDTPLYLDWVAEGDPTPPDPIPPDPTPPDPTPPGPGNLRPGKLEITKTGEALVGKEENADGIIAPVYEEVKVEGAEFEVYAKEDIYVKVDKEAKINSRDTGTPENPGDTGTPENPGDTGTPENPGDTGTPENPGDTGTPENPGDTGTPENPDDTNEPEKPIEQETKLLYAKDTLIKKIVTDENGKATLESLPTGKYYIKEVKAGEGFILNEEVKEFEIKDQGEDNSIQKVEVAYKNERQKINIGGEEGLIVEKIADKKVYKPGEEIVYTIRVTNTTKSVIKDINVTETMIEGKFEDISTDNITKENDKTIKIKELKPDESVELKFIANIASPAEKEKIVNLVKATGKTEEPNPEDPENPIIKDIEGEDEEEIYIATKELVIVKEALKDEYEVGETVQYVIKVINNGLTDITDILVEEKLLNGKFVYVEEANKGGSEVKQLDNQRVSINKIEPGKMITLRYEYEISKDTQVTVDDNQRIILGNKVTVTGKTEIPDPSNPDKTIPTDLEDESTEEVEIKTDGLGKGLGIIKRDIETGKTIQGAVIGLYAAENIKGANGEEIIARDTLIEKVTTDELGRAKYTVDLPLGKYYIKEIEAPEKYMLSEEKIEIDATYKGQEIDTININKILTNRKIVLDFSIEKNLSSVSVNGQNIPIKDNKLVKLELKPSDIKKAEVIAKYKIIVKNKVNIAGKTKVLEIVPKGFEVVNAPEYWVTRPDGILETEVNLNGNETKELEISLKWKNSESNLGSGINVAKLETDGDTNTDDDNSQATIIISVKTGEVVSAIIIIMMIASLAICGYMTTLIISKMKKGPDINGINFLKNKNK